MTAEGGQILVVESSPSTRESTSHQTQQPAQQKMPQTHRQQQQQRSSSSSKSLARSLAIIGLACITVSVYVYLHLHRAVYAGDSIRGIKYRVALSGLPELPSALTQRLQLAVSTETSAKPDESMQKLSSVQSKHSEVELPPRTTETVQEHVGQRETLDNLQNSTLPFAYAFVIGGCDPDYEPSYQNYLFNILVAARIFQERGSAADVVVLFQVSAKAKRTRLPHKDSRLLHALGVQVYYIPQQTNGEESFYRTQLDKFRILGLTQYKRIIFMDGDVMPLANLDYLFEYSVSGTLKENLVIQGQYEPANGGFFMVQPGHLEQAHEIVQWRERTAQQLAYPYFDEVVGWGQALAPDDPWRAAKQQGTNYTFLAAFADQGLLYYYTKYARMSVSVVMRDGSVENWAAANATAATVNATTTTTTTTTAAAVVVSKQTVLDKPFAQASESSNRIEVPGRHNRDQAPLDSVVHFTGSSKPWLRGGPPKDRSNATQLKSTKHYWFWKLTELDEELQIGLDFEKHWSKGKQRPPLGLYPVYAHVLTAESNLLTPLERDMRVNTATANQVGSISR